MHIYIHVYVCVSILSLIVYSNLISLSNSHDLLTKTAGVCYMKKQIDSFRLQTLASKWPNLTAPAK